MFLLADVRAGVPVRLGAGAVRHAVGAGGAGSGAGSGSGPPFGVPPIGSVVLKRYPLTRVTVTAVCIGGSHGGEDNSTSSRG